MHNLILATAISIASMPVLANSFNNEDQIIIKKLIGKSYSGTPWVFEHENEFTQFELLRDETRGEYTELFVYMSLQGEKACHNTLGLITLNSTTEDILSVDMVHHAPAKACLTYQQFKNP